MSASLTPDLSDPSSLLTIFAPVAAEKTVGLAVSGGPDSLALLLLAQRWAAAADSAPRLVVYSLDHGLRPEAGDEVAMVGRVAADLGVEFRPLAWSGDKPEAGLQEAARQARYRLMGAAMAADGATVLVTAHHRSDQAETILMRLAHGSGIDGLKGMTSLSSVEGVRVFRPLLDVEPQALRAVIDEAGLVPAHDPSNDDDAYERVRWRRLLPSLAREGLDGAALVRFAARMAEADQALSSFAAAGYSELVAFDGFGAASITLSALRQLGPAVGRRVLSKALDVVGGRQKTRALGQVERLYEQITSGTLPKGATLLGTVVRVKDEIVSVAREPGRELPMAQLLPQGEMVLWDERFEITNLSADQLVAEATSFFPRHRLEEVLGAKVTTPAEAIRTAPIVRDKEGGVVALGRWSFDDRIKVAFVAD